MEKKEIVLLVAVLIFAGFRLYSKYAGKRNGNTGQKTGNELNASAKDDYEPYSGK